jgi:hypothetical protein
VERHLTADAIVPGLANRGVNRRLAFVRWVRRTHGWFGLWGALLGLLMGFSGIWLNHRNTLKLQLPSQQQLNAQLALPDPRPETAEAMAVWLQHALKLIDRPTMSVSNAAAVAWAGRAANSAR